MRRNETSLRLSICALGIYLVSMGAVMTMTVDNIIGAITTVFILLFAIAAFWPGWLDRGARQMTATPPWVFVAVYLVTLLVGISGQ